MIERRAARAWQRMLSGRRLDLIDPSPLDIEIADIAHGLARVARWNGQTKGREIFSVAQHSLLVEALVGAAELPLLRREARLAALLHDAPEYVIGDMISPFKAAIGGDYKPIEARLQAAIHIRFGLPAAPPDDLERRIKNADRRRGLFRGDHARRLFHRRGAQTVWRARHAAPRLRRLSSSRCARPKSKRRFSPASPNSTPRPRGRDKAPPR